MDRLALGTDEARKRALQGKLDERAKKKEFQTGLFYGDILYTSWGYDQTNINCYEVVEVVGGQTAVVREVALRTVADDSSGTWEKVVPVPGKYVGPEQRVRIQMGDRAKIDGHSAAKWDGHPLHQTGPYGGH